MISEKAMMRDPLSGKQRRLDAIRISICVFRERAARLPNGRYRVLVSQLRVRAGRSGNFRYYGTRSGRSQRHRPARASARAARCAGLRRLAQSRRLEGREQPRHARAALGRRRYITALHVRLRFDPRKRHSLRAAATRRQRIHLRAGTRLADACHAWPVCPAMDVVDYPDVPPIDRTHRRRRVRSGGVEAGVSRIRPSTTCGRTTRSGPRVSSRDSATPRFARSLRRRNTAIPGRPTT